MTGGKKRANRYPKELKQDVLKGLQEEKTLGTSIAGYAKAVKYNRKTLYNWKRREKDNQLQDKKPIAHNIPLKTDQETREKIIRVYKQHKGRYGCKTICQILTGVSASTVNRVIKADKRAKAKRYEFAAPDTCWGGDVLCIKRRQGNLLIWQDEASRHKLIWDLGKEVNARVVKTVLEKAFTAYQVPLVIKHDNGKIFLADEVQDFLKANGVISLPNPPYYAMYNGKVERGLREIREWIKDVEEKESPTYNEIYQGVARAVYEENEVRPRLIFEGRTSSQVYRYNQRLKIDRKELLSEIEELEKKLINGLKASKGGESIERKARRLAI